MLKTGQIRAGRALLGWNQMDLAKAANVSIATIRRLEAQNDPLTGYISTIMRIQEAFEQAGIRFLDPDAAGGLGVRLSGPKG